VQAYTDFILAISFLRSLSLLFCRIQEILSTELFKKTLNICSPAERGSNKTQENQRCRQDTFTLIKQYQLSLKKRPETDPEVLPVFGEPKKTAILGSCS